MRTSLEKVGSDLMSLSSNPKVVQESDLIRSIAGVVTELDVRLEAIDAILFALAKRIDLTSKAVEESLPPVGNDLETQRGRLAVLNEVKRILAAGT